MITEPMSKGFRELLKNTDSIPTLTLDELKEYLSDIFKRQALEDDAQFLAGPIAKGLYRLPDGSVTGEEGWRIYNEILNKEASTCQLLPSNWMEIYSSETVKHTPLKQVTDFSKKDDVS